METWLKVLLIVVAVIVVVLALLVFFGNKLRKKTDAQKAQIDAAAQTMSMLIIDKKKMKLMEANLPKIVIDQTPKMLRRAKLPIVKAKVGPKVMTLIADEEVFKTIPIKTEVKATVSGIYITGYKCLRASAAPAPEPKKKGLFKKNK